MTTRWTIGLSPGSTAGGVDAVLLETEGIGLELRARRLHAEHLPYPPELCQLLRAPGGIPTRQLSLAHRLLGETFAAAARLAADGASFPLQKVQCLGCSGHPLWHEAEGRLPSTLTLGMAAAVAERTGVTVVSDLAARDVVAGGQGTPLTALADWVLFRDPAEGRCLVHLGGAASVVFLPAGGSMRGVLGFTAGPGGLLLDGLMRRLSGGREGCDTGGKHAVQGCCLESLLQRWLSAPALQRRPPRAISPLDFGEEFITRLVDQARASEWSTHDVMCTATHLVARAISGAVRKFLPSQPARLLLSGGGARNGLLWRLLEQDFAGTPLEPTDRHGVPARACGAAAMAVLAALTLDGVPANVPAVTGAAGSRLLGSLTPGSPSNWARCLAWMASHTAHQRAAEAGAA